MSHEHQHPAGHLKPAFGYYVVGTLRAYGRRFPDIVRVFLPPFLLAALSAVLSGTLLSIFPYVRLASFVLWLVSWVLGIVATMGFVSCGANPEGVPLLQVYRRGLKLFLSRLWSAYLALAVGGAIPVATLWLLRLAALPIPEVLALDVVILALLGSVVAIGPRVFLVSPALALAGARGAGTLSESARLVRGRYWSVLGRIAIGGGIFLAAYLLREYGLDLAFGDASAVAGVQLPLAGLLAQGLTTSLLLAPIGLIFAVSLYEDLAPLARGHRNPSSALWIWLGVAVFTLGAAPFAWAWGLQTFTIMTGGGLN